MLPLGEPLKESQAGRQGNGRSAPVASRRLAREVHSMPKNPPKLHWFVDIFDDKTVNFTLLENGLDFIWSAVEHLGVASTKRDLKYATLHLVSGIELVLKERVRREDWSLLFPDPSKPTQKSTEVELSGASGSTSASSFSNVRFVTRAPPAPASAARAR